MASRQNIISALVVLVALAIYYSRVNVSGRRRTTQSPSSIKSSPSREGFEFQITERADYSKAGPWTATIIQTMPANEKGAYKGRPSSPPLHIHHYDDEEFTILEGSLGYVLDGKEGELKVGQSATFPAGIPHTFWNKNPKNILKQKVRLINRSGKHAASERFFEQWAGVAYDNGGIDKVNPLQLFLTLEAGNIELEFPQPVKLLIKWAVLPLGKLLGYKGFYPNYVLP